MSIHQNLKKLRQIAGLTQEEVASKIGVTRQAISGYESGRRQPDLELIEKLAQLYHTDILAILYGTSAQQKTLHRFQRAAIITFVLPLLLMLLRSCGLLCTNALFPVLGEQFVLTDAAQSMVEAHLKTRMSLLQICDALGCLSNLAALIGCIVLAVLLKNLRPLPSGRASLLYGLLMLLGNAIFTVPFALLDHTFGLLYYLAYTFNTLWPFCTLGIYRIFLEFRQRNIKKPPHCD